ncbi:general transcription factor 3C polypeptide 1-like [Liolophura sinensis]|uniref:general transcription factor 3C polypeptide 1-like n=1 Tax=Liolophura sinensis TaxID=3198878 RepID=UPI003158C941
MEDMIYDPRAGKRYGLAQKFKRLRVIHQLLWYHVYGYEGTIPENLPDSLNATSKSYLGFPRGHVDVKSSKKGKGKGKASSRTSAGPGSEFLVTSSPVGQADSQGSEMYADSDTTSPDGGYQSNKEFSPPIYLDEMTWKRYLPPLPKHSGYPEGWCLISDVLLALPLKIFCQTVNIPYKISGLMEMLEDPEKQFYPIMAIPFRISQQLMYARKYVFAFHAILVQLCHIGLLSFGHQQLKEKDQVFVYLHRKATIVDTRTSLPGYMFTRTPDKDEFPVKHYDFSNLDDVEKYWSELMDICLSTSLGRHVDFHSTHANTAVQLPPGRISLADSVAPCTPETVRDTGFVPGDGLGAGGLDSSLFCHLYRNWSYGKVQVDTSKSRMYYKNSRERKMIALKEIRQAQQRKNEEEPSVERISVLDFTEHSAHTRLPRLLSNPRLSLIDTGKGIEVVRSTQMQGAKGNRGGKGIKRKAIVHTEKSSHVPKKLKTSTAKGRKKSLKKRLKTLDEADKRARRLMKKQRVDWTPAEDSMLLLSKVANLFLSNKKSGILVPWSAVRDVLHDSFEVSKDKTSYACQRRVAFTMKNPQTILNVQTFLAEALHDKSLVSEFRRRNYKSTDPGAHDAFIALLKRLREKFISGQYTERVTLPQTLNDLHQRYTVTTVGNWKVKRVFEEPKTKDDIFKSALRDIIHSYMSLTDKKGRSHEVYQLFNQYSDEIVSYVFSCMRDDRIITRLKKELKISSLKPNQISTVHAHHLSQSYFNTLLCRMPQEVFDQSWTLIKELWKNYNCPEGPLPLEIHCQEGGHTAAIVNLFATKQLKVEIEIPEQILVIDTAALNEQPNRRGRDSMKLLTMQKGKDLDDEDDDVNIFIKSTKMDKSSRMQESAPSESEDGVNNSSDRAATTIAKPEQAPIEPQTHFSDGSPCFVHVTLPKEPVTAGDEAPVPPEVKVGSFNVESKMRNYTLPVGLASRSTLSMLRNQCIDASEVGKLNPQDFFLINACDIKATLLPHSLDGHGDSCLDIFVSPEVMNRTLRACLINQPVALKEQEEWNKLAGVVSSQELNRSKLLYGCIEEAGSLGIQKRDILMLNSFSTLEYPEFQKIMENLMALHLVLRVGVVSHRYVSHKHAAPWLLHGHKDTRGRSKPTVEHIPLPQTSTPDSLHAPTSKGNLPEPDQGPSGKITDVAPQADDCQGEATQTAVGTATPGARPVLVTDTTDAQSLPSQRASLKRKLGEYEGRASSYKSTYDRVVFVPRPWRKPEGWMNRDLFLVFIKVVGSFVMLNPGTTQKAVLDKFIPILQPVSTLELLEVLEDIGAITKVYLRKSNNVSLFSKPSVTTYTADTGLLDDGTVLYEGSIDLLSRIAQFCEYVSKQHQLEGSTKTGGVK